VRRLLAALVLVAACGMGNKLDQGEVIEKSYDDPDHGSQLYCASYTKYGCALWLTRETYDGPHWKLRVVGFDDDGKERKEWHEVTQTLYETADVGVTVNFPEDRVVPR
jgi:hypothetical protein